MFPARSRPLHPLPFAVVAALMAALMVGLAGCGGSAKPESSAPSAATLDCRQQWRDLGKEVVGNESLTQPSSLASRWRNISATIDYYAVSAKSTNCGDQLARQRGAIRALEYLSAQLQPFDMELQLGVVQGSAQTYSTSPRPPAPSPSPSKKGTKPTKAPRPPKPATVAAALRTLTKQAPIATEEQRPGWQQAEVVELSDALAVGKAVKDLRFLSSESAAFAACSKALKTIQEALKVTQEPIS